MGGIVMPLGWVSMVVLRSAVLARSVLSNRGFRTQRCMRMLEHFATGSLQAVTQATSASVGEVSLGMLSPSNPEGAARMAHESPCNRLCTSALVALYQHDKRFGRQHQI